MPDSSTITAGMDGDHEGRKLAEVVMEAAKLTGRSDPRFEMEDKGFYRLETISFAPSVLVRLLPPALPKRARLRSEASPLF